jgi:hypothetical protein
VEAAKVADEAAKAFRQFAGSTLFKPGRVIVMITLLF